MNMRKIIAVLAAVLMLCSIVPMSVFAANGDVVTSINWNDGEKKFDKGDVVAEGPDGSNCFKWTATGGWSATYMVVKNMDSSKDYTITMKAKGSVAGGMGITIQNGDWGSYWNGPTFNVTTEWQDVVVTIPAGTIPFASGSILFKWQDVGVAMDLYVDDFVITEGLPKKPLCENGDFEAGKEGWGLNQSTAINATAAKNGALGAHLKGNGGWGSMLERTFDVEAGKNYELSFWIKAIASGTNIQLKQDTWQGASIAGAGGWFSKTEWTQITYTFTAPTNKLYLNFCGSGAAAEELYVDDVVLLEIKDPSFDGYIYNGDFETGKTDSWTNLYGSTAVEVVEGRDGGFAIKGTANAWNIVYQEVNVTPNTNYSVWAYAKDASQSALWIKNAGGNGDITNKSFAAGSDWSLTSVTFNSGSNSKVWIGLMSLAAGGTYTVDDVFMFEAKAESNDGYIKNGDFETGSVSPWDNLWGSCPTVEIIKGGKDDNFALNLVSGEWKHLRQTGIAVEANTEYKISLWAKNVKNMNLLVKDNGDSKNLANKGISGGAEWTYNEFIFNTGDYTSVLVSLMGGAAEAYGQFDNIKMEKAHTCHFVPVETTPATCCEDGVATLTCTCGKTNGTQPIPATGEHTYEYDCSKNCSVSGKETRPEADHAYDDKYDADCNYCGAIREVPSRPVIEEEVQTAVSEDVSGLAFKFDVNAVGAQVYENTQWVYKKNTATIMVNGEEFQLKYIGAIATNKAGVDAEDLTFAAAKEDGKRIINIKANKLAYLSADGLSYAIRITNIPEDQLDTVITTRPYFMYNNAEGEEIIVYGDATAASYNEAAN